MNTPGYCSGWLSLPPEIKIKITDHLDGWSALSASRAGLPLSEKKIEDTRHYVPWAAIFRLDTDWAKIFAKYGDYGSNTVQTIRELFLVGKDLNYLRRTKTTKNRSRYLKLVLFVSQRQNGEMPCPDHLLRNLLEYRQTIEGVFILKSKILLYFAHSRPQPIPNTKILLPLEHLLQIIPNKAHILAFNKRRYLKPVDVVAKVVSTQRSTNQETFSVASLQYDIYFPCYGQIGTLDSRETRSVEKVLAAYLKSKYPRSSIQYELLT